MKERDASWVPWPEIKGRSGGAGRVLSLWPEPKDEQPPVGVEASGPQHAAGSKGGPAPQQLPGGLREPGPGPQQPGRIDGGATPQQLPVSLQEPGPGPQQQPRRGRWPSTLPPMAPVSRQPWGAHIKNSGLSLQQQQEELYKWQQSIALQMQLGGVHTGAAAINLQRAGPNDGLQGSRLHLEGGNCGLQGSRLQLEGTNSMLQGSIPQMAGAKSGLQDGAYSMIHGSRPQEGIYGGLQASRLQQERQYGGFQGSRLQQDGLYGVLQGSRLQQDEIYGGLQAARLQQEGHYGGLQGTRLQQERLYGGLQGSRLQQEGLYGELQGSRLQQEGLYGGLQGSRLQQEGLYGGLQRSRLQTEVPYLRRQGSGLQQQWGLQRTGLSLAEDCLQQGPYTRPHEPSLQELELTSARYRGSTLQQHADPHLKSGLQQFTDSYLKNRVSNLHDVGYSMSTGHKFQSRDGLGNDDYKAELTPWEKLKGGLHPDRAISPIHDPAKELPSYLNPTTDLLPHTDHSKELWSSLNMIKDHPLHSDISKEWSSYPNVTREQLPFHELPREMSPTTRASYAKSLLRCAQLSEEWTRYPTLKKDRSPLRSRHHKSRSSHSSMSANASTHQKGRSRSSHRSLSSDRSPNVSPSGKKYTSSYTLQLESMGTSVCPKVTPTALPVAVQVYGIPKKYASKEIEKALKDEFKQYGEVTDIQIFRDPEETYALVFFSQQVALERALRDPLIVLFGKPLTVSPWVVPKGDRERPVKLESTRVIYLENIDPEISHETLQRACERFGEILDIEVELKEMSGSAGYTAAVQYWNIRDAYIAAASIDGEKLGKYMIKATSGKNKVSDCVWVDHLPKGINVQKLFEHFVECGPVSKVLFDRLRGSALILYKTTVSARQCVRSMGNGKTDVDGQYIQVDYANGKAQVAFCQSMVSSGQDIGTFLFE